MSVNDHNGQEKTETERRLINIDSFPSSPLSFFICVYFYGSIQSLLYTLPNQSLRVHTPNVT